MSMLRFLSVVLISLTFVALEAAGAACGCAGADDVVRVGFKQVARFAGKITVKFSVLENGQPVVKATRTYTAGSVILDGGTYRAQSYGCGQFADTVFIDSAPNQVVTIETSFNDDPFSPDYTETDPSNGTILTVVSPPSATCLHHFADVTGVGPYIRVIPGVPIFSGPRYTTRSVEHFVTRPAETSAAAPGASDGPKFGQLEQPKPRPEYMDANDLGDVCDLVGATALMTTAEAESQTTTTSKSSSRERKKGLLVRGKEPFRGKGGVAPDSFATADASEGTKYWKRTGGDRLPTGRGGPAKDRVLPAVPDWVQPNIGGPGGEGSKFAGSADTSSATTTSSSTTTTSVTTLAGTPGSVVGADIGAVNLPIELGHQQGRLFYTTPAIDASAYSAARLSLSGEVSPVARVNDPSTGVLRQLQLAEVFVDIRTASTAAFEVRFYNPSQIGAFDGTLFPINDDSPFCVWRIENPDALPQGRIRFVQTRDGQNVAHLAAWQPAVADNVGTMSIAYHNEATIETRTYYRYTSPKQARGERIQKRAGPLASPGPIVSDTFDAYEEFYNWSATGEIYQALVQRTEDPVGAALTTTWVYYDTLGVAPNSLNGVIYPDGYWERYGRYADGTLFKLYRPFKDNPSGPGAASDSNSLVTTITFPATGDPTYQIEVSEDRFAGLILRHDEIHRQVTSGPFYETTRVFLNPTTYTQAQTVRTGNGGIVVQGYEPDGTRRQVTYLSGYWSPVTETFSTSSSGSSVVARRFTETQGSLPNPGGVANQTHIVVTVRDERDRVLLEEIYVHNGSAFVHGSRTDWISRIVNTYDSRGLLTKETRNGRVHYEAGYDQDGRLSFEIDEIGIRMEYAYDGFGRKLQAVRKRGTTAPEQTTTYVYDAAGRLRFETVSAAGLSSTTEYRYDLAGRRTHVITPDGLVETTSELYYTDSLGNPVHREVTVTSPAGATTVMEYHRDRRLLFQHGTAVPTEFWGYDFLTSPQGHSRKFMFRQLGDASPQRVVIANWRGDVLQESQPGFGNVGAFHRLPVYGGGGGPDGSIRGLLASISTTGQATVRYEYDQFGRLSAEGVDLNGNGILDRASTEPLTTNAYFYEYGGTPTGWTEVFRTSRHLTAGVDSSTLQEETRSRLTGLASGVISERTMLNSLGQRATETVILDRSSLTRTTTLRNLAADSSSQAEVRTEAGGLLRSLRRPEATADTVFDYDGLDRLTSIDDPAGGSRTYVYNAKGQLTTESDSLSRATKYTYHPTGGPGAGKIATLEDAAAQVSRFTYTVRNQVFRQWGLNAYASEYAYDDLGRLTGLKTFRTTDTDVNWSQDTWPTTAGSGDLTRWTYDYWTGLLAAKTYANNSSVAYTYDGSLRLFRRTNARNQATTYGYDTAGRLTSITYPAGSGTPNVIYGHDRGSRIATVTDGSGTRTLTYNDFDQLKNEVNASGLLSGVSITRAFDSHNRPGGVSAANGAGLNVATSYDYDALSRFETITNPTASGGAMTFTYTYESGTNRIAGVTTKRGSTTLASSTRSYDALGRLTRVATLNGSGAELFGHGYAEFDPMDRRKTVQREDGKAWKYDYNARGEVTAARKEFPAIEGGERLAGWQSTYAYDTIGNRVGSAFGGDPVGGNLRASTYTTNALNQYVQRTTPGSMFFTGEAAADTTVEVQLNEQPVSGVIRQGAAGDRRYFSAEYVTDNALQGVYGVSRIRATPPDGHAPTGQVSWFYMAKNPESFTYDDDGNLTSDDRWSYTWDAENRLIAIETRSDRVRPLGPLPAERRLKLEFAYDAQWRRIQKKVSTWNLATNAWVLSKDVRYVYDQWNCLAELEAQATGFTVGATYVWGLDLSGSMHQAGGVGGLLVQANSALSTAGEYFYACDGQGNVAGLIALSDGSVAAHYDYDAFGELLRSVGPMANVNTFRFSTKMQDESSLHYYGYRYYSARLGRWPNRDPLKEEGGVNLYGMIVNDTVNYLDLLGMFRGPTVRPFPPAPPMRPGFPNTYPYEVRRPGPYFPPEFVVPGTPAPGTAERLIWEYRKREREREEAGRRRNKLRLQVAQRGREDCCPTLELSRTLMPKIAAFIQKVIWRHAMPLHKGFGEELINLNRFEALADLPRSPGESREEYPFASTLEGGELADHDYVPIHEQNVQGGVINAFYRRHKLNTGDCFYVKIVP